MPNPELSRERVHRLAEACGDSGDAFQSTANRLISKQKRLARFIQDNVAQLGPEAAQVALYMLSVTLRIFDQSGGRMHKVSGNEINAASAKIQGSIDALLPADDGFADRAKAQERSQPHILDEVLWALYERDDKEEGEVSLEPDKSAMVYLMLWAAVEALDQNWKGPETLPDG